MIFATKCKSKTLHKHPPAHNQRAQATTLKHETIWQFSLKQNEETKRVMNYSVNLFIQDTFQRYGVIQDTFQR